MKEIRYSELSSKAMFALYNEHATKIGAPPLRRCPKSRVEMAKALALILTRRPVAPILVRDVVIEELCKISHYDKEGNSVGFAFSHVLKLVKARVPNSKMTLEQLMVHGSYIRNKKKGYKKAILPLKRTRPKKETKSLTDPRNKITEAPVVQNIALSIAVSEIDKMAQAASPDPTIQMGALMLAQAKAFKRITAKIGVTDRAGKHRMLKLALQDFEMKIWKYGMESEVIPPKL